MIGYSLNILQNAIKHAKLQYTGKTFDFPNFQISSLLSMSASSLRDLLCDPKGCHVADAFAESDSVGEKSRDGLVKALKVTSIQFGLFHIC